MSYITAADPGIGSRGGGGGGGGSMSEHMLSLAGMSSERLGGLGVPC